jgi:hypothetical protein
MRQETNRESYSYPISYAAFSDAVLTAGSDGWVSSMAECHYENAGTCPDCGVGMVRHGLCLVCPTCGYGSCG